MRKTSRDLYLVRFVLLLVMAFVLLAPCRADAAEEFVVKKSKINVVAYPTMGVPAIVEKGGSFDIRLMPEAVGDQIEIISLKPAFSEDEIELDNVSTVHVPPSVPEGLYNLYVKLSDGREEVQYHSVKVTEAIKPDFKFVVIADIHFGDTRGQYFAPDKDFDVLRKNVLVEASDKNPEFILLAGDITSMPNDYTRDYEKAWEYFKDYCRAPMFMVPGNHDGYGIKKKGGIFADGKIYWSRYFGDAYFYFDYGKMRVIGIDNYDWPAKLRSSSHIAVMNDTESINRGNMSPGQFEWLKETLASAGDKNIIGFAHLRLPHMKGGTKSISGDVDIPGVLAEDIIQLMADGGMSHVFVGHMHKNEETDIGGVIQLMTNTSGSVLYDEEQLWGFNTVYVKDWKIEKVEYTVVEF